MTEKPTFSGQVGAKAARKLKARRHATPGIWFGLGMMGLIGWSVVVPTLAGAALAQQPDASATITRTLFVGLAMIESTAIYCFVVSMILLFANPFWNHVIAQTAGK